MKCFFEDVALESVAASVPSSAVSIDAGFLGADDATVQKLKRVTGIDSVAVSPAQVTAADLCLLAWQTLARQSNSKSESLEALIFVSQSRDYLMPSTSSILQDRIGMSKSCLALDIPSGCAGYIHGLFVSSALIASGAVDRVLLLCGETNSKLISGRDKTVTTIFGDAGSASVVARKPGSRMYFNFGTDGSGHERIIVREGGCRSPITPRSLEYREFDNGNFRRPIDMEMDGMAVLNFALSEVPKLVADSLADCRLMPDDLDLFAVHQANRLIVEKLAKKCRVPLEKSPFLAGDFGNTGPASIPLLLSQGFSASTSALRRVLLCGFGVGFNWGGCVTDLSETVVHAPVRF